MRLFRNVDGAKQSVKAMILVDAIEALQSLTNDGKLSLR